MGHHYVIWASDSNILLAQKKKFRARQRLASFQALDSSTIYTPKINLITS